RRVVANILDLHFARTFGLERESRIKRLFRLCLDQTQPYIRKRFIVRQHLHVANVSLEIIAEIETRTPRSNLLEIFRRVTTTAQVVSHFWTLQVKLFVHVA